MLAVPVLDEVKVTVHPALPGARPMLERVQGLLANIAPVDIPVWLNMTVPVGGRELRMLASVGILAVHVDAPLVVMLEGAHEIVVTVGRLLTVMMKGDPVSSLAS